MRWTAKIRPSSSYWPPGLLIVALVLLAYWPALHNGFIWDDDAHLTQNPCIVGPLGLIDIWTSKLARICPLVQTTFWVGHKIWGLAPFPYHLLNILMHAGAAVVLWLVLRQLKAPGAWLGATLWALHPVGVESVAWITEMKNTQSAFFYLLSILFFVKWLQETSTGRVGSPLPGAGPHAVDGAHGVTRPTFTSIGWATEKSYALALLFGALAMASKSSTVILPLVLGLCAWWVDGRWRWRNAVRLAPFFLFSAAAGALSMWTQKLEGATGSEYVRSGPERLVTAGKVAWFYLGKLLWPHPLIFIYPRWMIDAAKFTSYLPVLAAGLLLGLFWLKRRSAWGRPLWITFVYFLVALLPVLGILDHYFLRYSFVGDHFQYLASMGPLALAGAALSVALDAMAKQNRTLKPAASALLLAVLGVLTWHRAEIFRSSDILWSDTLAKNPECWMAHNNLGLSCYNQGRIDDAINHYQAAIRLKPDDAEAHNNLGIPLAGKNQVADAVREFQEAIRLDPGFADPHNNLGIALAGENRADEAISEYQEAIRLKPDFAEARNNLGIVLTSQNRIDEAITQFREAIRLKPDFAGAHNNLGLDLTSQGRLDEAIGEYQEALRLQPDYAAAHDNLGVAFARKGRIDDAIAQFQEAVRLDPGYADARDHLARALAQKNAPTGR